MGLYQNLKKKKKERKKKNKKLEESTLTSLVKLLLLCLPSQVWYPCLWQNLPLTVKRKKTGDRCINKLVEGRRNQQPEKYYYYSVLKK